ncbi:MAG: hypothetical protein FH758_12310 [Firmicutes bacterium]|nr:hypothetical protein [Bacillota bacterium]
MDNILNALPLILFFGMMMFMMRRGGCCGGSHGKHNKPHAVKVDERENSKEKTGDKDCCH